MTLGKNKIPINSMESRGQKWNIGECKIDNGVTNMVFKPINYSFFQQPTLSLARALLGKLLVKETELGSKRICR